MSSNAAPTLKTTDLSAVILTKFMWNVLYSSRRCRNFPGMVNNTSIDWLFPWPDQALLAVATELITPDNPLVPREHRQQIIEHVVEVHKSVIEVNHDFVTTLRRQNYVTPRNFLDFINTYQVLYNVLSVFSPTTQLSLASLRGQA